MDEMALVTDEGIAAYAAPPAAAAVTPRAAPVARPGEVSLVGGAVFPIANGLLSAASAALLAVGAGGVAFGDVKDALSVVSVVELNLSPELVLVGTVW